jgi:hypothetical protein
MKVIIHAGESIAKLNKKGAVNKKFKYEMVSNKLQISTP